MRYYKIVITDPKSGKVVRPAGSAIADATYTSFVAGKSLPGALHIELDIPVGPASVPMGGALIRIFGVSVQEIAQANDLTNKKIEVYGGMQRGLPLANPAQAGLLTRGFVFQAFGNWIGTEQTLDLVIMPGDPPGGTGAYDAPINITLDWKKGTKMGPALKAALSTAMPGFSVEVAVSEKLVAPSDQPAINNTITQLGQWAKRFSKTVIRDSNYNGVEIIVHDKTIKVSDGTVASKTKQISFVDLIGQPTWIEPFTVQLKMVMRADLMLMDKIKMPKSSVINTAGALSSLVPNQKLTFQGEFLLVQIRHLGAFRQADANSWVTVANAVATQV